MKRLFRICSQKPPLKAGFVIAALLFISFLSTPLALLARGEEPPPDEIAAVDGESERVIVQLNLPVQPEGQMSAQAVRGQRMEIAAVQSLVLPNNPQLIEAGEYLENPGALWEAATREEQREMTVLLLRTMMWTLSRTRS